MTDYIDREALMDGLDDLCKKLCEDPQEKIDKAYECLYCDIFAVYEYIFDFPASDVVPKRKYESKALLPCTCGKKRISVWYGTDNMKFCQCAECGKTAQASKTEKEARKNWNRMIEAERGDDEC